jgi:hypothetical protein
MFFVSVDSEGFRFVVSCLESTLVGWFVSVAFKWVRAESARVEECKGVRVQESAAQGHAVLIECGRRAANRAKRGNGWLQKVEMEMKEPR